MVIISYSKLRDFYRRHPDAEDALNNWYRATLAADWEDYYDVKNLFNSVDAVGNDRFVFNIRGNTYRLVAMIFSTSGPSTLGLLGFIKTMTESTAPPFNIPDMQTTQKITQESDYKATMARIEHLMSKGSESVSKKELAEIRKLAVAAQAYEQSTFTIAPPTTLAGIIEMKMYEMKLKQKDLAKKLKVSDTKLSMIMNGKQKPDVDFIKSVHKQLKVNGDYLLNSL